MLNIYLVVIGEKMPSWVVEGVAEYQKRIRGRMTMKVIEIPAIKRGKNADLGRIAVEEDQRLLAAVPKQCEIIALDRKGKALSTRQMADRFEVGLQNGEQLALLVGGPEGLSPRILQQSKETWSLSALTFAHPVVRIMLAEQVYRCYSVLEGLPYHR
ncbi:MAG: 23S rRNA (pseudouridine(1915)-N(3))-methyltransferase RlmH [Acidiferrobacterales bacterium]|nr:23S rRNA (pseudouridine(1915)-N(3))-methyltransferase RlmH [Acidiferrobacterales bacterium]